MSIGCLAITGAILTVVSIIGLMVEQNIDSRIMVICFCSGSTTNGNTLTVLLLDELRINRRNKESIHSNSPSVLSLTVVFQLPSVNRLKSEIEIYLSTMACQNSRI
ncbi:hypothetical protein TWF102_000830 [Orbilia oligospora]|uniref:Uncharacterized protein n=1 Tax=Orbilia oligospora TaxID=2813651 RepID=A0A7C8NBZ3_ORBOL|nr:hypothetical protein TWF102_000830 [Orbilia oligospora]